MCGGHVWEAAVAIRDGEQWPCAKHLGSFKRTLNKRDKKGCISGDTIGRAQATFEAAGF